MLSRDETVDLIKARAAPVIFLDTCVLLDVIRAPYRKGSASTVRAAKELLTGLSRESPTVYTIIGWPTLTEWNENVKEVEEECNTACSKALETINAVSEVWGFLDRDAIPTLANIVETLSDELKNLSASLRDASILLDKDAEALGRAFDRVLRSELPAKKGGKGVKDAVILEQALGLINALRREKITETCIFTSSNTADFASKNTTMLHPELRAAFAPPTSLVYSANLTEAVNLLKRQGWVP